jgi:hypothetical protein
MPSLSPRPTTVLLVLVLGLALSLPGPATASPHREPARREAARRPPLDLSGRLWSFLTSFWAEEGCDIDPNGRCAATRSTSGVTGQTDTGCDIDPNGRCTAASSTSGVTGQTDTGCYIDPNGCRLR